MSQEKRFGRRLPVPSSRQIRHELIVLGLANDADFKEWTDSNIGLDLLSAAIAREATVPASAAVPVL